MPFQLKDASAVAPLLCFAHIEKLLLCTFPSADCFPHPPWCFSSLRDASGVASMLCFVHIEKLFLCMATHIPFALKYTRRGVFDQCASALHEKCLGLSEMLHELITAPPHAFPIPP